MSYLFEVEMRLILIPMSIIFLAQRFFPENVPTAIIFLRFVSVWCQKEASHWYIVCRIIVVRITDVSALIAVTWT